MSNDVLSPLLQALLDLIKWLQERNVRGIIIGGVAASLLGRPRVTRDIDALILLDSNWWEEFLNGGQWVKEFSDILEIPEIYNDLEKILSQRKNSL